HLKFYNPRAEDWWRFREELDPNQEFGSSMALPPDQQLKAELASPRWELTPRGIKVEEKAEIIKRLGRSTDCADACVQALNEGSKARAKMQGGSDRFSRPDRANTGFSDMKERLRA